MNKKWILGILIIFIGAGFGLFGCEQSLKPVQELARINDYSMSLEDFENELNYTGYGLDTTDPKFILDMVIDKQLLIQEAQRRGLHQKKSFLKTIEKYWEQTLIKELMDAETERIQSEAAPQDQEKALREWIAALRKKADIDINEKLLKEILQGKLKK